MSSENSVVHRISSLGILKQALLHTSVEDLIYSTNIESSSQQHLDLSPVPKTEFDVGPDNTFVQIIGFVFGTLSRTHQRLKYQSIRNSRYFLLAAKSRQLNRYSSVILSILSSLSNLAPSIQKNIPSAMNNTLLGITLECAFCDVRIPLALLAEQIPLDASTFTEKLLEAQARCHANGCSGQKCREKLKEDETNLGVSESTYLSNSIMDSDHSGPDQNWLGSPHVREEYNIPFRKGKLQTTHPELYHRMCSMFTPLPPLHMKSFAPEYWPPEKMNVGHSIYSVCPNPRLTALNYYVQQPPDPISITEQITLSEARRRIREVQYDRGAIADQMDAEAKDMSECRKRHNSYIKSNYFFGKDAAYQLSQLGFYFVGDHNAPGRVRCSFCRRTFQMFLKTDAPYFEKDWDRRLIALLHRHAHLSATCPFSIGINGDDRRLSQSDASQVIEPLIRNQHIHFTLVENCMSQHIDDLSLRASMYSYCRQAPNGFPPLADDIADAYNQLLAELNYETGTQFDACSPDMQKELSFCGDMAPQVTLIDYLIGSGPKHPEYWTLEARMNSFKRAESEERHFAQYPETSSLNPNPESLANAGFFYTGTLDNVTCFWCGLDLNPRNQTYDPVEDHASFSPLCPWLLRAFGRHPVKAHYLRAQTARSANAADAVHQVKQEVYAFLCDVEDIAGGVVAKLLCPVDYRTDLREAKARVDLPANRALLDELGFSVDLLLHALESQLRDTGNDHQTGQQLLETLWAYEQWKTEKQIDSDTEFISRADELRRQRAETQAAPGESQADTDVNDNANVRAHQPSVTSSSDCVVCMSEPRAVVLMPCGHLAVCLRCCARLQQCPLCRAVIRASIRSFIT